MVEKMSPMHGTLKAGVNCLHACLATFGSRLTDKSSSKDSNSAFVCFGEEVILVLLSVLTVEIIFVSLFHRQLMKSALCNSFSKNRECKTK